ncbi:MULTISPECIES: ABC transporter permease [Enterococcus]|uniref:ABC transporter permease n=1 Tax=Enterococcus TaxID=1350 RepID=UPI000EE0457E|nr:MULTISPECIES: ABC transporter permease [Enterococcus]HCM84917.1 ABC transporter permease [Enterococcus sp.]
MFLAWKEIRYAKLRYGLIVGIMILVAYVVFMLSGLANGLADGNRTAIDDWGASAIILSEDSNKIANASQLQKSDTDRVTAKEKAGVGIYSTAAEKKNNGEKTNVSIFGTANDAFVVPKVIKGRLYKNDNEIIVSENLLSEGYKLNQQIKVNDQTIKIVGITKETTYTLAPVIYLNSTTFKNLKYGAQPTGNEPINLIATKGQTTIDNQEGQTKLDKMTPETFIENIPGYTPEKLTLNTMIYFLFVVVTAIIGIFMYVITLQKTSIFGVMKAQGVATSYLVRSILAQAFLVGIIGVAVAIGLSILTSLILPSAMPFAVHWSEWTLYSVILVLVAMIGGLFSMRTVTKVDPVTAIGGE